MLYEVPINLLIKTMTLHILNESGITKLHHSGRLTSLQYKSIRVNMVNRLGGIIYCYINNDKKTIEILSICNHFIKEWKDCEFEQQPLSHEVNAICNMWAKTITFYLCALSQLESLTIKELSFSKNVPDAIIPVYLQCSDTEQGCISKEEYYTISARMVNCIGSFLNRYDYQDDDVNAFILQYEGDVQTWDDIDFDTIDSVDNMLEVLRSVIAYMKKNKNR